MFPAFPWLSHAKKFDSSFIKYVSKVAKWIKLNVLVVKGTDFSRVYVPKSCSKICFWCCVSLEYSLIINYALIPNKLV